MDFRSNAVYLESLYIKRWNRYIDLMSTASVKPNQTARKQNAF